MLPINFKKIAKRVKQSLKSSTDSVDGYEQDVMPHLYPSKPYLGFSTLDNLHAAVHIDNIDERGIHGWVAYSYFCGRRSQGDLCIGDKTLVSVPIVIERNDVVEHFRAASAFYFRFPLDRISTKDLEDFRKEIITIKFAHTSYKYCLKNEEKDNLIKKARSSTTIQMLHERGHEAKTVRSQTLVNKEPLLSSFPSTKPIAFYLPQFHRTPENDSWWGPGFTEWTNVTQARPAFSEHHQPHIPSDLGFYDASQESTIRAQIELAQSYGIHGFCFHHYWFSGRRALTKPLDLFVRLKHDLGFMICWANENWTRRWDGLENEVLLYQEHDIATDARFIDDIMPYLLDERYISRSDGSKWLIVYRPNLMPDPIVVFDHWRKVAAGHNIKLHISTVSGFDQIERDDLGVDSFIQFPPLNLHTVGTMNNEVTLYPKYESVQVYDYCALRNLALSDLEKHHLGKTKHMLIPGVMPSWDNSARKKERGIIIHRSEPNAFKEWVRDAAFIAARYNQKDRFLFVNAWNEWAEGAHLEPDIKYGHKYLAALNSGLLHADKLIEQNPIENRIPVPQMPGEYLIQKLLRFGILSTQYGFFDMVYFSNIKPRIFDKLNKKTISLDPVSYNIEQINNAIPSSKLIYISQGQPLYIKGWIALKHNFQHQHPIFFSLKDKNNKCLWTISSNTILRTDVEKHIFINSKKHHGLGFVLNSIIDESIPKGTHILEANIVQISDDGIYTYLIICKIATLEIM